jgi:hypothetical protein
MKPYLEYFDWEKIPVEWLDQDGELIQQKYKDSHSPSEREYFSMHSITDKKIIDYCQPFFDFDISNNIYYQVVGKTLGIHMDSGRRTAYNYIIDAGGDEVYTQWYTGRCDTHTEEEEKEKLLYQEVIPAHTWHKIAVDIHHDVRGQIRKRSAITVFQADPTFNMRTDDGHD